MSKHRFQGRELRSRVSRVERLHYLDCLRKLAGRGDPGAMAQLAAFESIRNLKKQLMIEGFLQDQECCGTLATGEESE